METDFKSRIEELRLIAAGKNDPGLVRLLDSVEKRFEAKNAEDESFSEPTIDDPTEVGEGVLKSLKGIGISKELRVQIRKALAERGLASAIAGPHCW